VIQPYEPGTTRGAYRVVEYLGNKRGNSNYQQYRVACRRCGREKQRSRKDIEESGDNGSEMCQACYRESLHEFPKRHEGKNCKQCEGQSWRRPNQLGVATHSCRCGKMYEPEIIPRTEVMRSSAGWDNIASSGRVPCATIFESQRVVR
jgi:hypothetical protein